MINDHYRSNGNGDYYTKNNRTEGKNWYMEIEDPFLRVGDEHDSNPFFTPFEKPGPYFPGSVTKIAKMIFEKCPDIFLQIIQVGIFKWI